MTLDQSWSPGRLIFVLWRQIFVGRQDGTCFISSFWRLEFCGRPLILVKLCTRVLGDIYQSYKHTVLGKYQ